MLVGGLLIIAGLWFSSSKAEAYTAWCDKKITDIDRIKVDRTISRKKKRRAASAAPETQEQTQEQPEVCEV